MRFFMNLTTVLTKSRYSSKVKCESSLYLAKACGPGKTQLLPTNNQDFKFETVENISCS